MKKYLVFDLEMCTQRVKRKYRTGYKESEIIQIGAVLLNETYQIVDTYMSYVRPEFLEITPIIEEMTGISNDKVKLEPLFRQAIVNFSKWIGRDEVITVTWSKSDERQLKNEMKHKNYHHPRIHSLSKNWVDCQELFRKEVKADHCISLGRALDLADTPRVGHDHDALTDARNTAALFKQIKEKALPHIEIEPLPEQIHVITESN